jgi:hypothetical protein
MVDDLCVDAHVRACDVVVDLTAAVGRESEPDGRSDSPGHQPGAKWLAHYDCGEQVLVSSADLHDGSARPEVRVGSRQGSALPLS